VRFNFPSGSFVGKRLFLLVTLGAAVAFTLLLTFLSQAFGTAGTAAGDAVGNYSPVGNCQAVGTYSSINGCVTPLSKAGSISGTVTNSTGAAVPGICVYLYQGGGPTQYSVEANTALDGSYAINGLPAGSFNVEFVPGCGSSGSYAPQWYTSAPTGSPTEALSTPVVVTVGSTNRGISTKLQAGGAISGTVTDASSNLLSGICVSVYTAGTTNLVTTATTASDGTYVTDNLGAGSYAVKFAAGCGSAPGFSTQWYDNVTTQLASTAVAVTAGSTHTGINDALGPPGQISGKVTDARSNPLQDVYVYAYPKLQVTGSVETAYTAADGTYTIPDVSPGSYVVEFAYFSVTGYEMQWYNNAATEAAATAVTVTSNATTTGINDAMSGASGETTVSGTITGPGSSPLGQVCVFAYPTGSTVPLGSTFTASDGTYTLYLAPGSYDIKFGTAVETNQGCGVTSGNYATQWYQNASSQSTATTVTVTGGTPVTGVNDQLASGGTITGTVTASGAPLGGVCVNAFLGASSVQSASTTTAPNGTYSLVGLAAGSYDVQFVGSCAVSGSYATQWYDNVTARASATAVTVTVGGTSPGVNDALTTVASGSVSGTVTDPLGNPVPGICVDAYPQGSTSPVTSTTTGSDGTYELAHLAPKAYNLYFDTSCDFSNLFVSQWGDGSATQAGATVVTVTSGGSLTGENATLVPLTTGGISGTVTSTSNVGVGNVCAEVFAAGTSNFVSSTPTASDGWYSVINLPAGSYDVEFASCKSLSPYQVQWYSGVTTQGASTAVTVLSGRTTTGINATLTPTTGSISGTVTDASSNPLGYVCVVAFAHGSQTLVAEATSNPTTGAYTLAGLPVGSYDIEFSGNYCGAYGYATQWYNGVASQTSATGVPVTLNGATTGINAKLASTVGTISGTVLNGTAEGVSDVCVSANQGSNQVTSTLTGTDGTYSLENLAPGTYTVEFVYGCGSASTVPVQWYEGVTTQATATSVAVTAGHTTSGIGATLTGAPGNPLGGISGTVTDASSQPIAGICVEANGPGGALDEATTQSDGTYAITGLGAGAYTVSFSGGCGSTLNYLEQWYADATTQATATPVTVLASTAVPGVNATLQQAGVIAGTVTDTTTFPIAGICVTAYSGGQSANAVTATDGTYTISGLNPGSYKVSFSAGCGSVASYQPTWFGGAATESASTSVTVTGGATTPAIGASLASSSSTATISGTVKDTTSAAVSGFCVYAYAGASDVTSTITASDGTYSFTGLAPGIYDIEFTSGCGDPGVDVGQWYQGAAMQSAATPVTAGGGATVTGINATLQITGTISGTVKDSTSAPISGICVDAYSAGTYVDGTFTAGDGTYSIPGLTPGTYTVDFSAGCGTTTSYLEQWYNGASTASSATPMVVASGGAATAINATMSTGGSISGTVKDSTSAPISGICADAFEGYSYVASGVTQSNGTYTITGLPAGTYTVEFYSCGTTGSYVLQWYQGAAEQSTATSVAVANNQAVTGINATMQAPGTISGTVTNQPVTGSIVSVVQGGNYVTGVVPQTDGTYSIAGLTPGSYTVEFSASGSVTQWYNGASTEAAATPLTVGAGQSLTGINATLQNDGQITGTVTDVSSDPVTGACVYVYQAGMYVTSATSGVGGTYDATVPPGSYTVEFASGCGSGTNLASQWYDGAQSQASATPVTVTAGQTAAGINGQLLPFGSITGTTRSVSGTPLQDICVLAQPVSNGTPGYYSTTTAADGTYSLTDVPAGTYYVEFEWCGYTTQGYLTQYYGNSPTAQASTPVVVTPGAATPSINASMVTGGSVSGTVTTGTTPMPDVCVYVFNGSTLVTSAYTGDDGTYMTYDQLAPGQYQIEFDPTCSAYGTGGAQSLVPQWYGGSATQSASTPITVTNGQTTTSINAQLAVQAGDGVIAGTVTNALGTGSSGVCVDAYPLGQGPPANKPLATGVTGSNGAYALTATTNGTTGAALPVGSYQVAFDPTCGGSFANGFLEQWYNGATSESGATTVVVASASTVGNINDVLQSGSTAPVISSVTPSGGPVGGGTAVTINGFNLSGATATVGGSALGITSDTATSITGTTPAGASGAADVVVHTANGSATDVGGFTYAAVPTVAGISPNSGSTAGGTAVTITGTNLANATAVTVGGNPLVVATDTATSITGTTPTGSSGAAAVAATTFGGTATDSGAFTYVTSPTITGVAPAAGPTAGGTPVVISGANLTGATSVTVGGITVVPTSDTATSIQVTTPPHAAGSVDVVVTTALGTTTDTGGYTYQAAPTVSGIAPSSGPASSGTAVTITGTNLVGVTGVSFGSTAAASYTVNSSTSVTATSPSGGSGTVDITVTTPGGTSAPGTPDKFTFIPAPAVSGVTPTSGPATGGTTVTVTGTNLTGATAVRFGTTTVLPQSVTATSLTAVSPGGSGEVDVTVTTPGGTSATVLADEFNYLTAPVITSAAPPTSAVTGTAYGFTFTASGNPAPTFALATGAPAWLSINSTSGALSGTVPVGITTFTYSVVASNGTAPNATAGPFVVAVSSPPVFTTDSPPTTSVTGQSYSYTFTASGNPAPTFALATGAPAWLSINSTTGALSGTVPAGTTTFTYSVVASNGTAPNATAGPFTVSATTPPAFTTDSPPTTSVTGHAYSYTFTASGNPTPTFALATGAPAWLSINSTTGALSGTVPVGITTFTYSVVASNGTAPNGTAGPFVVAVSSPPVFTNASPPTVETAGQSYSYTFAASGNPAPTFALATGAPGWLSVRPTCGALSGTVPAGTTTFTYSVVASNGVTPNATAGPFVVAVSSPPVFTTDSPPTTSVTGHAYSYTFAASGNPAPTFALATGAPAWLSINPTSGALSGTVPVGITTFTYSVVASNGITPNATAGPLVVAVSTPPAFTTDSPPTSGTAGQSYSYTFAASGNPTPTFALATGAPGWL
jgi:hypothetical protein